MSRPPAHWVGDGFHVFPVFNELAFTKVLSPMLMFDYAAPKYFEPMSKHRQHRSDPPGVGMHPHRGFETVTIAFQGEVEHHDNHGGHGIIFPGDVQWMTAGRGIVHQEYHSKNFASNGGVFEMCQLWVNLPKKHKMVKPRYQAISDSKIPVVDLDEEAAEGNFDESGGAKARLIAGKLPTTDVVGPAKTYSPINLWDVILPTRGSTVRIPYENHHACIVFVRRGSVSIGGKKLKPQEVALLNPNIDNDKDNTCVAGGGSGTTTADYSVIELEVLKNDSAVLIMGGEPIDEPIANMGPFVMNTEAELRKAVVDYQRGMF